MDQPSSETSPKKTSRVRKSSTATAAIPPVVEAVPLKAQPEAVEIEPAPPVLPIETPAVEQPILVKPPSGMNTQSLAMVALVGTFIVILTCICAGTMIAMTFFLTAPWG